MNSSPASAKKNAAQAASRFAGTGEDFPRPLRIKSLLSALAVTVFAIAMIPFARFVDGNIGHIVDNLPIDKYTALTRQFANPLAVLLILVIIWLLNPRRRASIAVVLVALLLASVINDSIKHVTSRARPNWGLEMGSRERQWIRDYLMEHPDAPMRPKSADQWFWWHSMGPIPRDLCISFPSGHANGAFALASYLSALYPQARAVWYFAAVGCGIARIEDKRHYATDVAFGGATGWIVAQIVFSWAWPIRLGKRLFGCGGNPKISTP